MTASRSLPARPSLDSLRKQAKILSRDRSVSLRDAQLALAREYGFAGWKDLTAEVNRRLGSGLDWAAGQATTAIHNHHLDRLKELLAEYPALLSWTGDKDRAGLVGFATGAYGDAGTPERERWFTRAASAELLIDAGAVVVPAVPEGILDSRAQELLRLFHRRRLLPQTLNFFAALGDADAVRAAIDQDLDTINEAFIVSTNFHHETIASLLLERSIALDPALGSRVDAGPGRAAFMKYFIDHGAFDRRQSAADGLWRTFVMRHVKDALTSGDLPAFASALRQDQWLLDEESVSFQADLIGWAATINDRGEFLKALLDLNPAVLRQQPPPPKPIDWAFEYGHTSLLPMLTRIWPLPDELQYAAGLGNVTRMKEWFATHHHTPQHVLDTALAYAITSKQFEAADLVLAHGANINTTWNTHEPASLLHHAVFNGDYQIMQFLIDRGIDMTIKDYRWDATARGWAFYAMNDQKMHDWLKEQERKRETGLP